VSAKDFTLPLPLNWRVSQEIARRSRPICYKNAWYGDGTSDYVLCVQEGKRRATIRCKRCDVVALSVETATIPTNPTDHRLLCKQNARSEASKGYDALPIYTNKLSEAVWLYLPCVRSQLALRTKMGVFRQTTTKRHLWRRVGGLVTLGH
jgi:hypothetical protein